jgi:hypothetical protein
MTSLLAGRVGDVASHLGGCVGGPAVTGSSNVLINQRRALREGDRGVDCGCSGPWRAEDGAPRVLVNDRLAHRTADASRHASGTCHLLMGSPNVMIGNHDRVRVTRSDPRIVVLVLLNEAPLTGVDVEIAGTNATTGEDGKVRFERVTAGECTLSVSGTPLWRGFLGKGTSRFIDVRFVFDIATCCAHTTR